MGYNKAMNDKNEKQAYKKIIDAMQDLEKIGGPDTLEEYIEMLESVQQETQKRIDAAREQLRDGASFAVRSSDERVI